MIIDRFKFRVWDRRVSKYTDPMDTVYCIDEDGSLCAPSKLIENNMITCETDTVFLVEQCTGLRDEDGTLIYEGDILKSEELREALSNIYYVYYNKEIVCFCLKDRKGGVVGLPFAKGFDFKVIGNLGQNPELLEEK